MGLFVLDALRSGAPLLASQEENEWPREDHTNPFAQPERTGIVRVHQKSQDQPGAKVEPDRRTTAPDSRAHTVRRRHQPRRPPPAKIRPGRRAAKAWEDENRPQLSLTGPRLAQLLQVLIGLLRPQRVERLRPLRGLRAWLDRNAWSVVAASVHSRASLRYSSRRRGST